MALENNNSAPLLVVQGDDHDDGNGNGNAPSSSSSSSSVQELLECHACSNYMYPPIHECRNGLTLCPTCKTKVHNKCPTCRQEVGNTRSLALEKLAEHLQLPCKYYSSGCSEMFPYSTKLNHELQCNFRPYNCPFSFYECSVTGDIPFLVSHIEADHEVDVLETSTLNHRYVCQNPCVIENATWKPTVYHCLERSFCLHFEAFKLGMTTPVYMCFLRFMGDTNEANNYRYRLEVANGGRKQIWEGVPRSIRHSHEMVRYTNDGLLVPRKLALFFSEGDGKDLKLRVIGEIWKDIEAD